MRQGEIILLLDLIELVVNALAVQCCSDLTLGRILYTSILQLVNKIIYLEMQSKNLIQG